MSAYTIGLDLGGTNLRAAAIDSEGHLLAKVAGHTNYSEGADAILQDMVTSIQELRAAATRHHLAGIGVAVPGFIRLKEGVIGSCNNIACLENFPIRDRIEAELGAPVVLENDANAAALGEQWMGAGRGVEDLVLLTLGTGVGGGVISAGRVLHGYLGMAAELGHITVVPNGNPCGCGNRGCLEKHASARAISAMAYLIGLGDLTSEQVHHLAREGDPRAKAIFASVGEALGIALAMLINIFNYPLYLLGGGVLAAWEEFAPPMLEEARRRSYAFRTTDTRIQPATLGNEAGLYGAAFLPHLSLSRAIVAS